jgi:predicted nucleic acid-binding protein
VIVVDTNVVCYRWMASPHSEAADQAWALDPDWIVPLLWRSEFRNAFAGAVRKRLLTAESAVDVIEKAEAQLAGREFLVSSRAVMRLVAASRCSAYDCEFVALAEEHGIALVTVDRSVLRDFNRVAIPLDKFVRS